METDKKNSNTPVKKSVHAEREEKILSFWKNEQIFEKSVKKDAPRGEYTFYDGPPFANGTPHYGHILASVIKDAVPRFKTMQGYRVERRWGWDCHGLPVENLIEKELDLKSKKDIVTYGIGKFNEAAAQSVMRYADEWRKIVPRLGRWVDMDDDYRTMDASYTESVWWIFKTLYDKGLIYEGFKSMFLCPRCETTLSNFEVAQGYKDITDISVFVKFKLSNPEKIKFISSIAKGKEVSVLAWTTTPWTLPGNVALAINPEILYTLIKMVEGGAHYILAKDRLSVLKDKKYEALADFSGQELVGQTYEPLFNYYSKDETLKNRQNGWKIYGASFVTTEDGTGVVHIAPAFGTDDYELLKQHDLPFVQHVTTDGKFKKEVTDWAGMLVKAKSTEEDKNAHQKADIEVIKWLAHNSHLFEKEKLIHSYPHCWRCDTPLLNYASSSWFVKVTDLKDKLVKENEKVEWVPSEVGEGRFGNWLLGARDWAISRSRFWGAPIPVWREQESGKVHVIGSVEDLKKYSKAKNKFVVIRHGEGINNTDGVLSCEADAPHHLTTRGREQVKKAAIELKKEKFDYVFVSPFTRTMDTMKILKEELGWSDDIIKVDARLGELKTGVWNGKRVDDFIKEFGGKDRFCIGPEGGETYSDVMKRVGEFLYEKENEYSGKNILIVTHETPAHLLFSVAKGLNKKEINKSRTEVKEEFLLNAEVRKVDFTPIPHNKDFELDLHRPFIDDLNLVTEKGEKLVRVSDVFDCWFESGAMPYGQYHYPFSNLDKFNPNPGLLKKSLKYPADFIAEGLDQTRGWFYSMIVLGVALFGKSPYKKVIVNGLVLAEDGQKMSKRKQNYPDPMDIVEKYGSDSLRYYLLSSPVVRSQDLRFSEKGVDEITKKIVNRLLNVLSFYEMYADSEITEKEKADSKNVLDMWMKGRVAESTIEVTKYMESGELDRAVRPFMDLIDDLSTWYLRRSRDRFKGSDLNEKKEALCTTRDILISISTILAPFMPFVSEYVWQSVTKKNGSVHMESWPHRVSFDDSIRDLMVETRRIASLGLEARMTASINVRQPLANLFVRSSEKTKALLSSKRVNEFLSLIKDEVNIKEVTEKYEMEKEVELDTKMTPELVEEGNVREIIRVIQDLRKEKNLSIDDIVTVNVETDDVGKAFIEKNTKDIGGPTNVKEIKFGSVTGDKNKTLSLGEMSLKIELI